MRNPKRTAATASALMIGVGLVAFITIFAASTKQSISGSADRKLHADYIVDSGLSDEGGLSPALTAALSAHPELAAVTGLRMTPTLVDGRISTLEAVDTTAVSQIVDLGTVTGDVTKLGADGIAVLDTTAKSHGWKLGDMVPVTFAKTGTTPFTIRALYTDSEEWVGKQFVSTQAFDANVSDQFDTKIFVTAAPGVSKSEARRDRRVRVTGLRTRQGADLRRVQGDHGFADQQDPDAGLRAARPRGRHRSDGNREHAGARDLRAHS